jgi:nucleotide-binding universal stress UspA family protein
MSNRVKILLYFDGSKESEAALNHCVNLTTERDAVLAVLGVVDIHLLATQCGGYLSEMSLTTMEHGMSACVDRATGHLRSKGIEAHGHVAVGPAVECIRDQVDHFNAEWLVVGERIRSKWLRWLMTPSAFEQLRGSIGGCTVITVPFH